MNTENFFFFFWNSMTWFDNFVCVSEAKIHFIHIFSSSFYISIIIITDHWLLINWNIDNNSEKKNQRKKKQNWNRNSVHKNTLITVIIVFYFYWRKKKYFFDHQKIDEQKKIWSSSSSCCCCCYSLKQLLTFKHITHPIECTPKGYIMPQQQQQQQK